MTPAPDAPCRVQRCAFGCVLETGIGAERTRSALEWLLASPWAPGLIITAGFAGALDDKLQVGDIVVASEVVDGDGNRWECSRHTPCAGRRTRSVRTTLGTIVTVSRLVGEPQEKRELREKFGALAVDMESATVAEFCSRRGIPFGCVRAISDDARTALSPRLVGLLAGERVAWWRLAGTALSSPRILMECVRLARNTRLATRRLGDFLHELLAQGVAGGSVGGDQGVEAERRP